MGGRRAGHASRRATMIHEFRRSGILFSSRKNKTKKGSRIARFARNLGPIVKDKRAGGRAHALAGSERKLRLDETTLCE